MTKKTESTKAPERRVDAAGKDAPQTVTKLAEVENPADLTAAKIQEISGDDGTNEDHNTANKDVAEGLREAKAEAKGDEPKAYFHGHGGGAGEPG